MGAVVISVQGKPFEVRLSREGGRLHASVDVLTKHGAVTFSAAADESVFLAALGSLAQTKLGEFLSRLQIDASSQRAQDFAQELGAAVAAQAASAAEAELLQTISGALAPLVGGMPGPIPIGEYERAFAGRRFFNIGGPARYGL